MMAMGIELAPHQLEAIKKLKTGSVLCGGVGSGKSRTSLAYYYLEVGKGKLQINGVGEYAPMSTPRDLYIITTAKKRNSKDWEKEALPFYISSNPELNPSGINFVVDSWNNIHKYCNVCGAFFIFDEQRIVGSGAWVKAFYQIAKKNKWILLSATPGDTWMEYIPLFVANGFYKNKTEFVRRHVVYSPFTNYPKVQRYLEVERLVYLKNSILIHMRYIKSTEQHHEEIFCDYDEAAYESVLKMRWNIFEDRPIRNASELTQVLRKISNTSEYRVREIIKLIKLYPRIIIFYNFDYELEALRAICKGLDVPFAEWNGHKHMDIPRSTNWVYLVQYTAGAEGWNCIDTNVIAFYSPNYSYKIMIQSAGRIDRMNTAYQDLYYYHLYSKAPIDRAVKRCLMFKKKFNEAEYGNQLLA